MNTNSGLVCHKNRGEVEESIHRTDYRTARMKEKHTNKNRTNSVENLEVQ